MRPWPVDVPALVWIAAAFAVGIAAASRVETDVAALAVAAGLAAAGLAVAGPTAARLSGRTAAGAEAKGPAWVRGAAGLVAVACLGAAEARLLDGRVPHWPKAADLQTVVVSGVVVDPPEEVPGGWRATLRVTRVARGDDNGGPAAGTGGRLRLAGRGAPPDLRAGDVVTADGRFRRGRPAGNAGERAERDALSRRGLVGVLAISRGGSVRVQRRGGPTLRGVVAGVRARLVRTVRSALPEPHDGLFLSLLLGVDAFLPADLYRAFSRAGLVHLVVVSGTQIGIVVGTLVWIGRAARMPRVPAAVVAAVGVGGFAMLVGWAPSVGRAVIMAAVALGGVVLGRPTDRAATMAAAALVLLAVQPAALFDVGFQLSFAATWGLLFLGPVVHALVRAVAHRHDRPTRPFAARLAAGVAGGLSATLAAQVAVAPLLAAHFQGLPVAGLAANVAVLPLIAVLIPAGFVVLPLVALVPWAAGPVLGLFRLPLDGIVAIAEWFGGLRWALLPTPPLDAWLAAAALGLLGTAAACAAMPPGRARPPGVLLAGAGVLLVVLWWRPPAPPDGLIVTVLDVGQGDSVLIQSPAGRVALVDGGGEVGERAGWDVGLHRVVPALRRAGVRRLDVVLLSHPHEDHAGGLPAVMENFPVGVVLDPGVPHPSPGYRRLLRAVEARRTLYRSARRGLAVDLGAGTALAILHPPDEALNLDGDPVHARGAVARLAYGREAMLLTGDVEAPVERYLLERGAPLAAGVLKVGHHGSRTSTSPAFVASVRPSVAVISVGAGNPFGHPHAATLATLRRAGTAVYRTDRHGAVRLRTRGGGWQVETTLRDDARVH